MNTNQNFLPFALPEIGEEEIAEVVDSMRSGWITTGPKVKKFEEDFAQYIGAKHALAMNSATAGLHLALDAIGLEAGDKVIVPVYTFTSTAEVVRYFNADPIFCDVEEKTYNIDVSKLEALLSKHCQSPNHKVKAIMPVHMAGQACDISAIMKLAKKYNLKVIEDAAHSLPATSEGKLIGTIGDITVFSFYATKTITTAEGGMVTTDNDEYKRRIEVMRLHGFNRNAWDRYTSKKGTWFYEIVAPGYKYNLTDIAAAMGLHQLKKCNRFYERRLAMAQKYNRAFSGSNKMTTPYQKIASDKHSYHLYIVQVNPSIRDRFIDVMKEKGIGCSVHFIPLHMQPYWRDRYKLQENDFPVAMKCFSGAVSLPLYTKMTDADQDRVIKAVNETLNELS